jgi:hypothetical protein
MYETSEQWSNDACSRAWFQLPTTKEQFYYIVMLQQGFISDAVNDIGAGAHMANDLVLAGLKMNIKYLIRHFKIKVRGQMNLSKH